MSYYNWTEILENNSEKELIKIIKERTSEPEEKVLAAFAELDKRGIDTTELSKKQDLSPDDTKEVEELPILYSDKVIYTFSILFSVLFGGILFANNLKTVGDKKGTLPVIVFSVLYTGLTIYLVNLINANSSATFILNMIGALIINNLFWNKYIGKSQLYHKKSYKKPLIIALAIFIPLAALIIWATIVSTQL